MTLRWKSLSWPWLLALAIACAPTAYTALVTVEASHIGAAAPAFFELGIATPVRGHVGPAGIAFPAPADSPPTSPRGLCVLVASWTVLDTSTAVASSRRGAPSRPRSPPRS